MEFDPILNPRPKSKIKLIIPNAFFRCTEWRRTSCSCCPRTRWPARSTPTPYPGASWWDRAAPRTQTPTMSWIWHNTRITPTERKIMLPTIPFHLVLKGNFQRWMAEDSFGEEREEYQPKMHRVADYLVYSLYTLLCIWGDACCHHFSCCSLMSRDLIVSYFYYFHFWQLWLHCMAMKASIFFGGARNLDHIAFWQLIHECIFLPIQLKDSYICQTPTSQLWFGSDISIGSF